MSFALIHQTDDAWIAEARRNIPDGGDPFHADEHSTQAVLVQRTYFGDEGDPSAESHDWVATVWVDEYGRTWLDRQNHEACFCDRAAGEACRGCMG